MDSIIQSSSLLESIDVSEKYPFPYTPEPFTPKEKKVLSLFFTNFDKPVFAIFNLPQEVVGAMFSRYSRTAKSVRRLFLDEFWKEGTVKKFEDPFDLANAEERTKNFYRRVFAEYGDDSVIQMGSVHIAFEYASQLAVKAIEDQRVAAAYIEKSTRYVDFSNQVSGHYLFMEPPEIMNSKFAKEFIAWNSFAFDSYIKALPVVQKYFRKKHPLEDQIFIIPTTGEEIAYKAIKNSEEKEVANAAYERALKARSFDSVRLFLPLTMVSNLGAHFSGQAVENMLNKMLVSPISEVRLIAKMAYEELIKVSPNFLQHIDHKYGDVQRSYKRLLRENQYQTAYVLSKKFKKSSQKTDASLIDADRNAEVKLASQILFTGSRNGVSKLDTVEWAKKASQKELISIIYNSLPDRTIPGYNRRHKLPRAFEHIFAEIEFYQDYGVYKDLQRNRLSSTERSFYLADAIKIPTEYKDRRMKKVLSSYQKLFKMTKALQKKLLNSSDPNLVNAAEYIMLHGNLVRFTVRANLRQWVFFSELRTIEGGHPSYRIALQKAVKLIIGAYPFMKPLFTHVNWKKDVGLGRLRAEIKTQQKLSEITDTRT